MDLEKEISEKEIENLKEEKEIETLENAGTEETPLNLTLEQAEVIAVPTNDSVDVFLNKKLHHEINLQPNFQRKYVWSKKQASNLIESLLLNIPIPPIFVSEDKDGIWEVIDGQQRLTAIDQFVEGTYENEKGERQPFALSKLSILTELSDKTFNDFTPQLKRRLLNRPLPWIVVKSSTNKDVKFEMFNRLNSNITKLNNQELRNCLYRGTYNEFIKEMAQNSDFQALLHHANYQKRMIDVELILMFFSFLDMDYHQYNGDMKQVLNRNMMLHQYQDRKEFKEKEDKFKKSIALIKYMFARPEEAFRIFSVAEGKRCEFTKRFNQGLFLVLMYGFTPYDKHQVFPHIEELRERFLSLQIGNEDFRNSLIGSGTNSRANMIKKFHIWMNAIQEILDAPEDNPRCFPRKIKEALYEESQICKLCGQRIFNIEDSEVDHIIPYDKGGKTVRENAQLVHRYCNRHKSDNIQ